MSVSKIETETHTGRLKIQKLAIGGASLEIWDKRGLSQVPMAEIRLTGEALQQLVRVLESWVP